MRARSSPPGSGGVGKFPAPETVFVPWRDGKVRWEAETVLYANRGWTPCPWVAAGYQGTSSTRLQGRLKWAKMGEKGAFQGAEAMVTNVVLSLLAIGFISWQVRPWLGVRRIGSAELSRRMRSDPTIQIVDLRSPAEYAGAHVPDSQNIPLNLLRARYRRLDPARPLVLVCDAGSRAGQGYHFLKRRGFGELFVLAGGMRAWALFGLRHEEPLR